MDDQPPRAPAGVPVAVWDLPTRLFHWLLVVLVAAAFATAKAGGAWMFYHPACGEALLALLLFRLVWGFIGSAPSRFAAFVAGPRQVRRYARTLFDRQAEPHLGHNPLGGWSVLAMLIALFLQAATGLFADDGIATAGPLARSVGAAASRRFTALHYYNHYAVAGLAALHIAAVLFHLVWKRENLIVPMLTGVKRWQGAGAPPGAAPRPLWLAALAALLGAGAVFLLTRWPP
jgi:cytochrome b